MKGNEIAKWIVIAYLLFVGFLGILFSLGK